MHPIVKLRRKLLFGSNPEVLLHLGAHKTATTFLQQNLLRNRQFLSRRGISYVPLRKVRLEITSKLREQEIDKQSIKEVIAYHSYTRRLIISDENLIGYADELVGNLVFPNLSYRLGIMQEILKDRRIDILFSVREYSGFIVSMYSEYLRHYVFCTFDEYIKRFDIDKFNWIELIGRIKNSFPDAKIHLVDFSKFMGSKSDIIDFIIGRHVELEEINNQTVKRQAISEELLDVLQYAGKKLGDKIPKMILTRLETADALQPAKKFMPLRDHIRDGLKQRYENDVAALRRKYRFIN